MGDCSELLKMIGYWERGFRNSQGYWKSNPKGRERRYIVPNKPGWRDKRGRSFKRHLDCSCVMCGGKLPRGRSLTCSTKCKVAFEERGRIITQRAHLRRMQREKRESTTKRFGKMLEGIFR